MLKIPLRARSGEIKAYAIIDDADFDLVAQYTWHEREGYARTNIPAKVGRQQTLLLHQLILGKRPGFVSDHINGDTLDNRRENLRLCRPIDNSRNRGTNKNNTSGHKGVVWRSDCRKWIAQIRVNYKTVSLGCYPTIEEAAAAYRDGMNRFYGEFARQEAV